MKVTVFNGSPRGRNSNTHRIVEPLLEGAREAGAETEEVFLVERDIKHCRGCFGCWGKTPGKCVINDEMPGLMDLYLESDYPADDPVEADRLECRWQRGQLPEAVRGLVLSDHKWRKEKLGLVVS
jgi:hypothetical protein